MTDPKHIRDLVIITIVFLLCGSAIAAIFLIRNVNRVPPREQVVQIPQQNIGAFSFSTSTIQESDAAAHYEVSASYPQFQSPTPSPALEHANALLQTHVTQIVAQFKNDYAYNPQSGIAFGDAPSSTLQYDFEVVTFTPRIISVRLINSTYGSGAAHPNTFFGAFNFDVEKNQELTLRSLTTADADSQLTDYATKILRTRLGNTLQVPRVEISETGPAFVITQNQSLLFMFNPYDVASYADGEQEVAVPLQSLQAVLTTEGRELAGLQ